MSLELGPCGCFFGTKDSEVDLGKTEGGVVITFSTDVADLVSDQNGTSPEDQVISGQGASIACPLADITLANLAIALNQTVKTSGDDSGIAGANLVGGTITLTSTVNGDGSISWAWSSDGTIITSNDLP